MVQSDMLKGNTFQDSTTAKNTSNILLKQKLRAIQRSAGLRKVLPCFEPCQKNSQKRSLLKTKIKYFQNFYLLYPHRVTRIQYQKSRLFSVQKRASV